MTDEEINLEIFRRLGLLKGKAASGIGITSCPYHEDKHPSASINYKKGLFHCFSCQKSSTARGLYYDITGHGINRDLGIESTASVNSLFRKEEAPISYEETPKTFVYFEGRTVEAENDPDCRAYLEKRGIDLQVAKDMKMRYAYSGYTKDKSNMNDKDEWIYVKNRLLTPVYENGKLLSLEMRDILGKEKFEETKEEKHLGEDVAYKKVLYPKKSSTNTLYQYDHLDKTKPLYFLEGLMDLGVLRADPFFENSTSVFGASIGQRQQYLLKKFPELIYIADHDKAGLISIYNLKKNLGVPFKYIFAPRGCKDVGDIPQNLHITVKECRDRKWLATMKSSDDFDIIAEAKKCEFINAEDLDILKQAYN